MCRRSLILFLPFMGQKRALGRISPFVTLVEVVIGWLSGCRQKPIIVTLTTYPNVDDIYIIIITALLLL